MSKKARFHHDILHARAGEREGEGENRVAAEDVRGGPGDTSGGRSAQAPAARGHGAQMPGDARQQGPRHVHQRGQAHDREHQIKAFHFFFFYIQFWRFWFRFVII